MAVKAYLSKMEKGVTTWFNAHGKVLWAWAFTLLVVALVGGIWYGWALWGVGHFADTVFAEGLTDAARKDRAAVLGQAGDVFGGVNALFAAGAFVGVAVAAFFQFQTLQEVKGQATHQAFEQLFFHLLEQQREFSREREITVTYLTPGSLVRGGEPIETEHYTVGEYGNKLRKTHTDRRVRGDFDNEDECMAALADEYVGTYEKFEQILSPYFRSLYHVVDLIDRSQLGEAEKVRYANIARSTLNSGEVLMLALNGASPLGAKMKPLIERYGLLKHAHMPNAQRLDEERLLVRQGLSNIGVSRETTPWMDIELDGIDRCFIRRHFSPLAVMGSADRFKFLN